ncbi:PAS domain-containing sensor histidine kinase [Comamonas squillarum]|uniref:histidine kinase n=1 Tax=Comamonas squillarum TaxID=2977320 RepID=A0ABY5ZVR9_9BURK|nr:PAS domain-containing sensor histidine kinase [Comamonas sp. PR12]UXC18085.1 PAS domain-containing sensor histidine kinase [Comamonas sp. PR12]
MGIATMAALALMETPFKRLWRGYLVARVFVALLLALGAMAITPAQSGPLLSQLALLGAYGISAMLYAALSHQPPPQRRVYAWLPTIGMDLLLISLLEVTKTGTYTLTPMFGLAVLFAGTLGGWLVTLGSCAYITIFLIVESLSFRLSVFDPDGTQNTVQAGLAGAAYFLVGILVRLLASRVERETLQGLRNAAAANQQEQINALILQNLPDGVLVADQALQVRIANPAAMTLLGHPHLPLALAQLPAWRGVVEQVTQTFAEQKPFSQDLALTAPQMAPIGLHVRTWLTHPLPTFGNIGSHDNDPLCLVFLHDLREIEARLRTEKMAAMGRMSAAVAHEIRNPLTAITQANALLDEELTDPGQKRLTYMVEQNAQRLGRIAEDILDIARVHNQIQPGDGDSIALNETVLHICHDWMALAPAAHTVALSLSAEDSLVAFDTGHLRQLLYNLLNNGQRYRRDCADSLRVSTHSSLTGTTTLVVWSDGAPIEPTIEKHLFEPFFSSESRSSGLGLYICRELCTRHGAMIRYERQSAALPELAQGNAFIVQFRRAASPAHPQQTDLIHQA